MRSSQHSKRGHAKKLEKWRQRGFNWRRGRHNERGKETPFLRHQKTSIMYVQISNNSVKLYNYFTHLLLIYVLNSITLSQNNHIKQL